MVDIKKTLFTPPTISELSEVIAYQREEIQRLENVLRYYKGELAKLGWQCVEVPE